MNALALFGLAWDTPQFYGLVALAALVLVLLANVAYFLPSPKAKLPAIVISSVGCFLAGLMVGMLLMALFGYHWYPQPAPKLPPGVAPPMQMGQTPGPPRGGPGGVDLTAPPKEPPAPETPRESEPSPPSPADKQPPPP